MTRSEFDTLWDELITRCKEIMDAKRPEYTMASVDVLANFKRVGERTGTIAGVAWATYFLKHCDAVTTMMTRGGTNSEPMRERFADAINYLVLGYALWAEAEHQRNTRGYDDNQKQALLKRVQEHFAVKDKGPQASNTFNGEPWPPQWYPQSTGELTSASPLPPPTQTFCVIPNE